MKKITIPDGMYQAALKYQDSGIQCSAALGAALLWLSENPIVPTAEQAIDLHVAVSKNCDHSGIHVTCYVTEWQRRMFLGSDEDEPIKDLLKSEEDSRKEVREYIHADTPEGMKEASLSRIRLAYKRGKEGK